MIEENIEKSGLTNIEAVWKDALVLDEEACGKADIVVADLPCSGLGVLGKKPDLKYRMNEEQIKELAGLQRRILTVVNQYVKPGGRLIYSTCTVNREENEENGAWFARQFPQFHMIREKQMLPGIDPGDGFYIAVFQKEV